MEWLHTEDKSGYSIMHSSTNEQYIVIDGLNPDYVHTPGTIEAFLTQHYNLLELAYWVLVVIVFSYIIVRHIYFPLSERRKRGLRLFSDD